METSFLLADVTRTMVLNLAMSSHACQVLVPYLFSKLTKLSREDIPNVSNDLFDCDSNRSSRNGSVWCWQRSHIFEQALRWRVI